MTRSPPVRQTKVSRSLGHGALLLGAMMGLIGLSSCHAPQKTEAPAPSAAKDPAALRLALAHYLPSAGLIYLIDARPRRLLADKQLVKTWSKVLSEERLSRFAEHTGIDPRTMDSLVVAGYPLGTVYLFDAQKAGPHLERSFVERARSTQIQKTSTPDLTHLTGVLDGTPHAMVHVKEHLFALVEGDISLAKIIVAFAQGKLKKSPSALNGRLLASHASFHKEQNLRAFLVGPFESARDPVSAQFAAGVAAFSFDAEEVTVFLQASGVWPEPSSALLDSFFERVFESRTLRALGWGFPVTAPHATCEPDSAQELTFCQATGTWKQATLAEATFRITGGSTSELTSEAPPPGWTPEVLPEELMEGLFEPEPTAPK